MCSGHGTCDWNIAVPICTCPAPWTGPTCENDDCLACVNAGTLTPAAPCTVLPTSVCNCDTTKYSGSRCQYKLCPSSCNSNGQCDRNTGLCACYEGYFGEDCSGVKCINDCSGNGRCIAGVCTCYLGFFGPDCSGIKCPRDCGANGGCNFVTGKCKCATGYTDQDCMFTTCPFGNDINSVAGICSSQGDCDYKTGLCTCYSGFSGVNCSFH